MTIERRRQNAMPESEILRANFTISPVAKAAIERVRRDYDAQFGDDPAAVLSVAWGLFSHQSGHPSWENVVISFYPRSMLAEVAHGIQEVSGVKLIFFTTEEYSHKFEGKILDHSEDRGFFLRKPN
jgi:hypothetical protein